MLRSLFIVASLLACSISQSQQLFRELHGKEFVSPRLEYFKLINDSTIFSSINPNRDSSIYFSRNDTFFIRERFLMTDGEGTRWVERIYDYKIIKMDAGAVELRNVYRYNDNSKPWDWEDTLRFIPIIKLTEPTQHFKYLKVKVSGPRTGQRYITIDSFGNVEFTDRPIKYSINHPEGDKNAKDRHIKGKLTKEEFTNFKKLLSRSLPSRLPSDSDCPMDGATSDIEIVIGSKKILSTGCIESWPHIFLLNYLYDLDTNKGLIVRRS
jgi:hypothetical protein